MDIIIKKFLSFYKFSNMIEKMFYPKTILFRKLIYILFILFKSKGVEYLKIISR